MAESTRRFDTIERVVRDERRKLGDLQSTVMSRLASHTHEGLGGGDPGPEGPQGDPGVSVASAVVNGSGRLIVTLTDGTVLDTGYVVGPTGVTGPTGATGANGVSVTTAAVDGAGHLQITLSTGTVIDTGYVVGPQGIQGIQGIQGPAGSVDAHDHGEYLTQAEGDGLYEPLGGGGVTDHGALAGLTDDDHTQYHTDARGDARYYTKTQVDTSLAGKAPTAHNHDGAAITSGTVPIARIPTGTTSTTAALGNHLHSIYSTNSHTHDDSYPKGVVAYYRRNSSSVGATTTAGLRVCYAYCNLTAGRLYRVSAPSLGVWSAGIGQGEVKIRYTTNNTIPGTGSTVLAAGDVYIPASGGFVYSLDVIGFYAPGVNITGFVPGIFIGRVSGGSTVQTWGSEEWPTMLLVEDMGASSTWQGGEN